MNFWYELCDKYGIYVVAEANIESHGMGYGDKTLAKEPTYKKAHMERNHRHPQLAGPFYKKYAVHHVKMSHSL